MTNKNTMEIDGELWRKVDENVDALPYVIVRCGDAGVHAGYLVEKDPVHKIVWLAEGLRLWKWHGRTLSGLAVEGPDDVSKCKFGPMVGTKERPHEIAEYCEILPVSDEAKAVLLSVSEWVND